MSRDPLVAYIEHPTPEGHAALRRAIEKEALDKAWWVLRDRGLAKEVVDAFFETIEAIARNKEGTTWSGKSYEEMIRAMGVKFFQASVILLAVKLARTGAGGALKRLWPEEARFDAAEARMAAAFDDFRRAILSLPDGMHEGAALLWIGMLAAEDVGTYFGLTEELTEIYCDRLFDELLGRLEPTTLLWLASAELEEECGGERMVSAELEIGAKLLQSISRE
jgi:hypothetical protein